MPGGRCFGFYAPVALAAPARGQPRRATDVPRAGKEAGRAAEPPAKACPLTKLCPSLTGLILLFLVLSAIFSGMEIAFLSANKLVVELKRKKGSRRGRILAGFFERPSEFIGSMLVGNNIALVAFTTLMVVPLAPFIERTLGVQHPGLIGLLSTLLITGIVLIFGEFLPKTLFRLFADDILFFLAHPLRFVKWLLAVPTWLMTVGSNLILKYVFRTPVEEVEEPFTRLDLENFIKGTRTESEEDNIDTELFEKALHLRETRVGECMVPRTEIVGIDLSASIEELAGLFSSSRLSRIVVFEEDIDNILGYIHHQQLLGRPSSVRSMVLDMPFVPEVMRVRDLLNQFIKNQQSIACVVDEFGGTAGLITMEDILEEIFGEIEDEHDQEDYVEEVLGDDEYLFSGRLEIDYLNEKYPSLDLPEGEYHTLSGYLVMTTEAIPKQGDEIILGKYKYLLASVSDTKIETVRLVPNGAVEER